MPTTVTKKPWQSKTLLLQFITAALMLFWPAAAEYVAANPVMVTLVFTGLNVLLRLITKGAVQIVDDAGNPVA